MVADPEDSGSEQDARLEGGGSESDEAEGNQERTDPDIQGAGVADGEDRG